MGTSSSKITSLTITGTTELSSDINTSVQQSFSEKLTISNASAILNSSNFSFSTIEINTYSLTIDSEYSNEIDSVISGSGSLIKSGTGTLTLTQNNTFSGRTTISNGTLVLENDAPNPTSKTISGTGKIIIQPSSTSFSSSFSTSGWTFNASLSG